MNPRFQLRSRTMLRSPDVLWALVGAVIVGGWASINLVVKHKPGGDLLVLISPFVGWAIGKLFRRMPRRRFQFSLRLAVLLMTLVCVTAAWLGWVRYKHRLDEETRKLGSQYFDGHEWKSY